MKHSVRIQKALKAKEQQIKNEQLVLEVVDDIIKHTMMWREEKLNFDVSVDVATSLPNANGVLPSPVKVEEAERMVLADIGRVNNFLTDDQTTADLMNEWVAKAQSLSAVQSIIEVQDSHKRIQTQIREAALLMWAVIIYARDTNQPSSTIQTLEGIISNLCVVSTKINKELK